MRRPLKALGTIALIAISFSIGAFTAGARHWFQPIADITIKNDSGQDFSDLKLMHTSGGIKSIVALPALKLGESTKVHFFVAGEGSYAIEVSFSDGHVIKGGAGYIDSDYSATEVVGASRIESKSPIYGL